MADRLILEASRSPEVPVAERAEAKKAQEAARRARAELLPSLEALRGTLAGEKEALRALEGQSARKQQELARVEDELRQLTEQIRALQAEAKLDTRAHQSGLSGGLVAFLLLFSLLIVASIWALALGDAPLARSSGLLRWLFHSRHNPVLRPPS